MKLLPFSSSLFLAAWCTLFFLTGSLPDRAQAQCPLSGPVNLVKNYGFESINTPTPPADCSFTSGQKNDAFNGCANEWSTGVGTPSLCHYSLYAGGPGASANILPPEGNTFACLGSRLSPNSTVCENESIVQIVELCPGLSYTLSFKYNNMNNGSGPLRVLLTNTIPAICTPVGSLSDVIYQVDMTPTTVPGGTAPVWVQATTTIPPGQVGNKYLIFLTVPPLTPGLFDVGVDDVHITCSQTSPLIPQINAVNNDNNNFIFNGSTSPSGAVVTWCWDFGDGSTASGQNVDHTYATQGTHQVCLTISDQCGCSRTACQGVTYETCGCESQSLVLSPSFQYYTGPDLVKQDIILPAGTQLVISNRTLNIKNGCKFVVLRGASLVVDNSTLTNYCNGQKWQGIVVWGNSTVSHAGHTTIPQSSASDPGIAIIQNGSHLNYAQTALEPQRWWSDSRNDAYFNTYFSGPITDYWGGIVQGKGYSGFHNNRKSADIGTYASNNLSSFTDCFFTSSTPDPGNGTGAEGVNIWNTNGVTFKHCSFSSVPARGITTINAGITVTQCSFTDNYQGIQAGATNSFPVLTHIGIGTTADHNYFAGNKYGVSTDGGTVMQLWTNNFSKNSISGFQATGSVNFSVRDNTFADNSKGITVTNTGAAGQEILCNTHTSDGWGVYASANCLGVTFRKNKYDNKTADVLLRGVNGINGQLPNQSFGPGDQSAFNYFSVNESDNDIVTLAPTTLFRYAPPLASSVPIPADVPRTLPDCDDDDFCGLYNNYHNTNTVSGNFNCTTNLDGDPPCKDRKCLDSLKERLEWFKEQGLQEKGQDLQERSDMDESEMQATERRFLSDKRMLLEQWSTAGDLDLIEQMLKEYDQLDDKQLLFGFYLSQKNMSQAASVLNSLPSDAPEDLWFKDVQNIYIKYLEASTEPFVPTHTQDSLLETVGTTILPVGANARAIYYLLHGVWMEPVIELDQRQSAPKTQLAKAGTLALVPNPAGDNVRVRLPSINGTLRIFDLFGNLHRTVVVDSAEPELNTATLTNGIYLMHYTAPDGSHAQARLVIQH